VWIGFVRLSLDSYEHDNEAVGPRRGSECLGYLSK
jgi:hypothetical protein